MRAKNNFLTISANKVAAEVKTQRDTFLASFKRIFAVERNNEKKRMMREEDRRNVVVFVFGLSVGVTEIAVERSPSAL